MKNIDQSNNKPIPIWFRTFVIIGLLILAGTFKHVLGGFWQPLNLLYFMIALIVALPRLHNILLIMFKNPLIIGLTALAIFSIVWSDLPLHTGYRSMALILLTVYAAMLAERLSSRELLKLLTITMIIIVVCSYIFVIFLPQYGIGTSSFRSANPWKGIFSHKTTLGSTMALGVLITILIEAPSLSIRFLKYVLLVSILILLYKSNSKTGEVVSIGTILIYFTFKSFRLRKAPTIALVIALVVPVAFTTYLLTDFSLGDILVSMGRDSTLTGRADVWDNMEYAISLRPILGYGYSAFWDNADGTWGDLWGRFSTWDSGSGHNAYLDIWLQLGVVGLTLFILIYIITYLKSLRHLRMARGTDGMWIALYLSWLVFLGFAESYGFYINLFWALFIVSAFANQGQESLPERISYNRLTIEVAS
jgi:O-antigen ligase